VQTLNEGGNVFKDAEGNPRTQRINLADIKPTIDWLERVTGLPLQDNMLGSTGQKPTSGDLDLAVDSNKLDKDALVRQLSDYVSQNGQEPRDWVRKSGTAVHFLTPIAGRANTGFVQTDFMFLAKPEFSKFILRQDPASDYKGATRNVLMNSLAKSMGYKLNQVAGIADRATNEVITDDPDEIARMLLNPRATRDDLTSVERILAALKNDPQREAKLADFRDHMQRAGTPLAETTDVYTEYNETSFLARLRDRIVNQGMVPIMEGVRIEHPEDLVFDARPSAGAQRALAGIQRTAQEPDSATVKWDGKPAIIFGRKPTGEFVLTDKSGFLAKGYDGLATSPEMIARIMNQRGGERGELIALYQKLFPLLRRAVPADFRGYIQGDLLYASRPQRQGDDWVFTPNTVTYRVPVNSELGQRMATSQAAVAIHTSLDEPGSAARPIRAAALSDSPGLLILDPSLKQPRPIRLNDRVLADTQRLLKDHAADMDRLFDPQSLRDQRISDLPALMKQYINHRVRGGSYDNLVQDFGSWVQNKAPNKAPRIFDWANKNQAGVAAVFDMFLHLSALKNDIVRQLDAQSQDVQASIGDEPGHEGYVGSDLKYVDRMRFSAQNFAKNNPDLD
jgi:hypothetical protein